MWGCVKSEYSIVKHPVIKISHVKVAQTEPKGKKAFPRLPREITFVKS